MNDFSSDWKIPLYKIYTDDEDVNLITKIIKRGSNWALGPEIEEFENAIKNYVGTDYCITLNSGTSALHATFLAYGLQENDEIIVPSFSFISTANSVLFIKAKPVFADIEEETFGLNPMYLENKITSKTKCIVPMDYGGRSCKINEIKEITEENNLILVEDAAEALGSSINGDKVGSQSDASIFSFCGNKVLTTGEGGAVVTNSKEIYEKIKLIRSHGRMDNTNYFENPNTPDYLQLGYNWRMSSMTAALGISQLHKLDKIIKMRQENARYLSSKLSKHSEIITPRDIPGHENIYQMYSILLPNKQIRDLLHDFLTEKRIFSKVYFTPIHLTSFYDNSIKIPDRDLPITEKISNQVLTLPLYPNMTDEEKNFLVETIDEFFEINRTKFSF
jgi:perosamine synthetase